jgi:hypothetical protein
MIIKSENSPSSLFFISSGDWEIVVEADDKSSALSDALKACLSDDKINSISPILLCMNISDAAAELSMERSLKFIPTADAAAALEDEDVAEAIKTFFKQ